MMNTNYCHVIPLTYEEKVEMYMKLDKKEIINMLIEANNVIDKLTTRPQIVNVPLKPHGKFVPLGITVQTPIEIA